jgi:hypothetical protein
MRKIIVAALAVIWSAAAAYPQNFTVEDLARRTVERRAVEAAIWGMPLVNTDAMRQDISAMSGQSTTISRSRRTGISRSRRRTPRRTTSISTST